MSKYITIKATFAACIHLLKLYHTMSMDLMQKVATECAHKTNKFKKNYERN